MVTKKIAEFIRNKGISITKIAEKTGISYQILCRCFNDNSKRELAADELLLVCRYLDIDPFELMDAAQKGDEEDGERKRKRNSL